MTNFSVSESQLWAKPCSDDKFLSMHSIVLYIAVKICSVYTSFHNMLSSRLEYFCLQVLSCMNLLVVLCCLHVVLCCWWKGHKVCTPACGVNAQCYVSYTIRYLATTVFSDFMNLHCPVWISFYFSFLNYAQGPSLLLFLSSLPFKIEIPYFKILWRHINFYHF